MKKTALTVLIALACTAANARSLSNRVHHTLHNISHAYDVSHLYYDCADMENAKPCRPNTPPHSCHANQWAHEKIQELKACEHST